MTTFVAASNYQVFMEWCRQNDKNPRSRDVQYVQDEQHIRGVSAEGNEFVVLENGWSYSDRIRRREIINSIRMILAVHGSDKEIKYGAT